jgi:hypothetical protein
VASLLKAPSRDPITSAFFRYSEMVPVEVGATAGTASSEPEPGALRALLDEVAGDAPAPRLLESARDDQAALTLLTRALVELAGRHADRHAERMRELGYLANTLLAGVGARGERLRPLDAAQATLATCSLGLEQAGPESSASRQIERLSCDVLFRIGWRLLQDEVSRPAATAVERVAIRAARDTVEPGERASLERLAAAARTALNESRSASLSARLDVLADALDPEQLALLASLSDDVPALLAADGITLERIASTAQLRRARTFLEAL